MNKDMQLQLGQDKDQEIDTITILHKVIIHRTLRKKLNTNLLQKCGMPK